MIVTLIVLAIVLSISTAITICFKFKQENSILTTFLSIGFILYLFGLINIMKFAIYIIIWLAIICFIYDIVNIIKKKIKLQEIFTLGTLLYILLLIISTVLLDNTYYKGWDEFSHWGSNLKAMVRHDVFWSNKIYDGVHVVYQPLAGIYEYFFCKINGVFAEDVSYIGITTFIITLLLPILRNLEYKMKDIMKGFLTIFCVYCLIYTFGFNIDSIYIDLLLAILFATSMIYVYLQKEKEDKLILWLLLIAMVLLKDTGLLLAGIVLMQIFFKDIIIPIINKKKIQKEDFKKFGILCLILITMLFAYSSWKIYCKANGKVLDDRHDKNAIVEINIKDYIKGVTQIGNATEKVDTIAKKFYKALNGAIIISNPICKTALQLAIFANLVVILLIVVEKDKKQKEKIISMVLAMDIGFILYCLLLMATYMFAFTEAEGRALASYSRYMNTYFLAWFVIVTTMILNTKHKRKEIILLITALVILSGVNVLNIIKPVAKGESAVTPDFRYKANIIEQNVNVDDKVYLIYQNIGSNPDYHILRYCISPIVTNLMYEWNLGGPYFEGDIWTYDISQEEWEKKLKQEEFDYVFIAKSDERFINEYGNIFEEGTNLETIENHLFSVIEKNDGSVKLKLYK